MVIIVLGTVLGYWRMNRLGMRYELLMKEAEGDADLVYQGRPRVISLDEMKRNEEYLRKSVHLLGAGLALILSGIVIGSPRANMPKPPKASKDLPSLYQRVKKSRKWRL